MDKTSNYINVQLSSEENLKNKIISFSTSDENGRENRIQIAQLGTEKHVNIWIKKDQLESNYIFATVECNIKENERCNYLMKFSGHNYGVMKLSTFNYQYYVSNNNKEMKFRITNDLEDQENSNKILTVPS